MTKALSNTPLWPYIGVVGCLLVLTLLSPRSWQTAEKEKPVQPSTATLAAADVTPPSHEFSQSQQVDTTATQVVQRPSTLATASNKTSPAADASLLSLNDFQTNRQVAQMAPPVTERVTFDPSFDQVPSLPAPSTEPRAPRVQSAPRLNPPQTSVITGQFPVSRKAAESTPHISTFWPLPSNLLSRLDEVAKIDGCQTWAERIRFALEHLHRGESPYASSATEYLDILDASVRESKTLIRAGLSPSQRSLILRASYSIARRVEIWKQVQQVVHGQTVPVALNTSDDTQIDSRLAATLEELEQATQGEAWREYLLLDQLQALVGSGRASDQHQLARKILARMESDKLDESQLAMLQESPFAELAFGLRRWADEPVDCMALLDDIEAYEDSRLVDGARSLARHYQNSRWSTNPEIEQLSQLLNSHYRNANLRIAVASDLLNRLIPDIEATEEEVNETIQGAQIYGMSRIHTKLNATLVPDAARWRIGVEASGEVESSTAANAGPATFYNDALSQYLARKLLIVDRSGVRVWRAEAEAASDTGLTGLRTDFDRVPLLGWLARSIAMDQHDTRVYSAQCEAEARLAARVSERLDDAVHSRLEKAEHDFETTLLKPLTKMALNPVALDLHTTKTRLIGRYRLAGNHQLGAHTPRPQAPSDSLLSIQLHESALNNIIEQLKLDGKESDLRELFHDIGVMFARPDIEAPDDVPEGVTIRFAASEAIRVKFEQDRCVLTLRIAELKQGRRHRWRNFAVRAFYVPDPNQLNANLVREGSIELDGHKMTGLDRVALSGVFSKTLSRSRPFNLVNRRLSESEELQDLQVTQFVVTEGWIGVALGPQYGAPVERLAAPPMTTTVR